MQYFVAVAIMLLLLPPSLMAQVPVAIVEEVDSKTAGVEFMDFLATGRIISLASNDRLVIGYLKSCWRETIVDGTVTIGAVQSDVKGGSVERVKVRCNAGTGGSTSKETSASGAMVFRRKPGALRVHQTIFALSPAFVLKDADRLAIVRLDVREQPITLRITDQQLSKSSFLDLCKSNISLTPGGLYRATAGTNQAIFKVDQLAEPGSAAIIGRLVHM